jgi:hypothetical protein
MSAARSIASMFLRRAGLFSLVLALIAGIFGMHVMNGHHIMHGPAIAIGAAESAGHPHPAGAAAHGVTAGAARGAAHAAAGEEISAEPGCPDGDCSGISGDDRLLHPIGEDRHTGRADAGNWPWWERRSSVPARRDR